MDSKETKEVWVIQIPNPCNSDYVATEVYDDFDLFVKRSTEIRETWGVVAVGRSLLVNTRYY
jgi:hypothetical protein